MPPQTDPSPPPGDFTAHLAGLAPHGATAALRAARADVTRYTQGSHDALFDPQATGLTLDERLAAASYTAALSAAPAAAHAYRERLAARGTAGAAALALLDRYRAGGAGEPARLAAILSHTHALATLRAHPAQDALLRLRAAGLATRDIVALSQLIAFVAYQVRVVSALRALEVRA
jgi:uncharacterized protein YciW